MNIIDISWPISPDMTTYKNNKIVEFSHIADFEKNRVRDSNVTLNSHTGTHVDAPSHFTKHGTTIDNVPLESLIGPCRVLDLTSVEDTIMPEDLEPHSIQAHERILLKTKNSSLPPTGPFYQAFIYIHHAAAQFLADKKIICVGIDYLGIERNQPNHETHTILFDSNITIIEGLRLGHVQPGSYTLYCLPLAIQGNEAALARAILSH